MTAFRVDLRLRAGEGWWGGAVADGGLMPFGASPHRRDLGASAGLVDRPEAGANQSAPLLLSDHGRSVWSERPFRYAFDGAGGLRIEGEAEIVIDETPGCLGDAFRRASERHFPASGRRPATEMFSGPQWNTWIELPYEPTQDGVLAYARGVVEAGFPPGVLMIDDRWSYDYGTWVFDATRFEDPAAMTAELHGLGFRVMLWLVPFVSPDSATSRMLGDRGWLITGADGRPVVREWWNGWSTMLDLGHPEAVGWLRDGLHRLQREARIDGFKFDAGDLRDWRLGDVSASGGAAVDYCEAWARLAEEFSFNELRACWKMGGRPLAQRLHDKPPTWGTDGLLSLIPEGIAQGLIGHPFTCPDMIGGGDLAHFAPGVGIDQELFVRFAQCSALFPMMQFSLAPWRLLDVEHLAAVRGAVAVREALGPELLALVGTAARTGEPILRPLAYDGGDGGIRDQFLVGPDLLVAPVLARGATARTVVFPAGRWVVGARAGLPAPAGHAGESDDADAIDGAPVDGSIVDGPAVRAVTVGLGSLPYWRRLTVD
ncbi:MAG TPA: glycoside hydrolase family 31 protein [Microlunatus sp.]|nr:glycoside hydrolase family 31 protein [Microlunatus sp.]